VIITGANSGLGLETARKLASCHATIILACRSYDRTQAILEELQKSYGKDKAYFLELDLSDLDSV
jgi:NAD(P)-dependent dehydrogenase (short-subunit alcohol dehydrogenase family)